MKKVSAFLFLGLLFISFFSKAQTSTLAASPLDPSVYTEYVGKYVFKEAPFDEVVVTVKDGKLYGEAVGQGSAELAPMKETSKENEIFEIVGFGGTSTFIRDTATGKVVKVSLSIQGSTLEGEKIE